MFYLVFFMATFHLIFLDYWKKYCFRLMFVIFWLAGSIERNGSLIDHCRYAFNVQKWRYIFDSTSVETKIVCEASRQLPPINWTFPSHWHTDSVTRTKTNPRLELSQVSTMSYQFPKKDKKKMVNTKTEKINILIRMTVSKSGLPIF